MSGKARTRTFRKSAFLSVLFVAWLAAVVQTRVQRSDWEVTLVVAAVMALACGVGYFIAL